MKAQGFTLLEIIVTLTIIGILAMAAIPIYRVPVLHTQQQLAKVTLFHLATNLEDYHAKHGSYKAFNDPLPENPYYKFIVKTTDDQYRLSAIPKILDKDDSCGTFFLDQDGNEAVSGEEYCW